METHKNKKPYKIIESSIGQLAIYGLRMSEKSKIEKALGGNIQDVNSEKYVREMIKYNCHKTVDLDETQSKPKSITLSKQDVTNITMNDLEAISEIYITNNDYLFRESLSTKNDHEEGFTSIEISKGDIELPKSENELFCEYLLRLEVAQRNKLAKGLQNSIGNISNFSKGLKSNVVFRPPVSTIRLFDYSESVSALQVAISKQNSVIQKITPPVINSIAGLQKNMRDYFKLKYSFKSSPFFKEFMKSQQGVNSLAETLDVKMETIKSIANIDLEKISREIDADFDTLGISEYDFAETREQQKLFVPELIQPIKQTIYKLYNDNDFLYNIDPRRFEEVVAELLHKQGYQVDLTKQTGDGGYDIIALSKIGNQEFKTLVECKRHSEERKIGIGIIRSFCDVLNTENANKGMIVTTSTFSKPSIIRSNSMGYKLDLIDRIELLNWTYDYLIK